MLKKLRDRLEQRRFDRMSDAEKIKRGFGLQWLNNPTAHRDYDPADFPPADGEEGSDGD